MISFLVDGAHAHDLATLLDLRAWRCSGPPLRASADAVLRRAGDLPRPFAFYNTHDEVDAFVAALRKVRRLPG